MSTDSTSGGLALAAATRSLLDRGETEEYLGPLVLVDGQCEPIGRIRDGDSVVFCCRRGEREVQLTEAFVDPELNQFPRPDFGNLYFAILTLYHEKFGGLPVAFAPTNVGDTLGQVVSQAGLRQLRLAETTKLAHVTFFFSGGRHERFPGQDHDSAPSLKGVRAEQAPEMRLDQLTAKVRAGLHQRYDLIVANLANGDVIGHSTSPEAKIQCAAAVDAHLGQMLDAARAAGYVVFVTADHGNLELMSNQDGTPHVAHTSNPVPFLAVDGAGRAPDRVRDGSLPDVAPTVLRALGLVPPGAMEGTSLVGDWDWGGPRRVLLLILDGWGLGRDDDTNPIFLAETPVWDDLIRRYACARLAASGEAVGLRSDKPGNSEAGHMSLGAGRAVPQDDVRLERAMKDGSFYSNEILCRAVDRAGQRGTSLHLIGLLSANSSHGSVDYPLALLRMAKTAGLRDVFVHVIFDGRSTQPGSAPALLEDFQRQVAAIGVGQIVSGVGRALALDRDRNYGYTRRAFDALVFGTGLRFKVSGEPWI